MSKKLLYIYILMLCLTLFLMVLYWNVRKHEEQRLRMEVRDFPQIVESNVINVVTDYNSIGYFVSGYSILGFQYELIRALEKEWGIPIAIFVENSLHDNLIGLQSGRYDIVARPIPITTALKDSFAFTCPIVLNRQVLVQRNNLHNEGKEPIRRLLDLAHQTIYVPEKSPSILRINNLSQEIGDAINIVEDEQYKTEQLVMLVAAGEIDFTVCDAKTAQLLATKFPEIDIDTDISFTQMESWAVRQDSPILLDSLNAWLMRMRESEVFERIYNRYY